MFLCFTKKKKNSFKKENKIVTFWSIGQRSTYIHPYILLLFPHICISLIYSFIFNKHPSGNNMIVIFQLSKLLNGRFVKLTYFKQKIFLEWRDFDYYLASKRVFCNMKIWRQLTETAKWQTLCSKVINNKLKMILRDENCRNVWCNFNDMLVKLIKLLPWCSLW